MKKFCIFIDESGWADLKEYKNSPYFTVCGVVVNEENREKLRHDWEDLKLKYFKSKNYVVHMVDFRRKIPSPITQKNFANDLEIFFKNNNFFLLFVLVDKKKALRYSWRINSTVYNKTYRKLIGNLVKFLIAKETPGLIYSEASNVQQDINLYQNFFHYITNGIPQFAITSVKVKTCLTAISFVTKTNNDPEEQIADLFGSSGHVYKLIKNGEKSVDDLDDIDSVLNKMMKVKMFDGTRATSSKKKKLYESINSFEELP